MNFGHRHPDLIAAIEQLEPVTLTSRAFHHDQLGPSARRSGELDRDGDVLPMNSGAEAVETAVKIARKWAYQVKGVAGGPGADHRRRRQLPRPDDHHRRLLHDRALTADFGPFTPGFGVVPYGDAEALGAAITPNTAAVLLEPIQGEAGVVVPPAGYLQRRARPLRRAQLAA